jgi:hypothetical protein
MEIELEDEDVFIGEGLLPGIDVVETAANCFRIDLPVDARGEHVFVVGAIEDADHATRGRLDLAAPEKIMAAFKGCRDLKGGHLTTLGVDSGKDVPDGAVFAGCVHALKDDQHRLGSGGIKDLLQCVQLVLMLGDCYFGGFLVAEVVMLVGGDMGKPYFGVRMDDIGGFELHGLTLNEKKTTPQHWRPSLLPEWISTL